MLTVRTAAELLTAAATLDDLVPLAAAAGCRGTPAPLDAQTRRGLGIDAACGDVRIAEGAGALRALLVTSRGSIGMRELLHRLASRLSSRTPHVLWIVIATEPHGTATGIGAWTGGAHGPRIAALIADRAHVVDSDAESLRAMSAITGEVDILVHARWVEVLGREALTRRFYRELRGVVTRLAETATCTGATRTGAGANDRQELALLYTSRLLFLAFLEAKGWLDDDREFLVRQFDTCMLTGGGFHRRVLRPLFFGTLNTPVRRRAPAARAFGRVPFLNGGLFSATPLERATRGLLFADDAFGALFGDVFARFRFTAREETTTWSEAAVDPEMLGRAFESLMQPDERRASGAFFTPHELVVRVTDAALEQALSDIHGDRLARSVLWSACLSEGSTTPAERHALRETLSGLSVLDPACGSGAFLVHVLERLAELLRILGDEREPSLVRRDLLTRCIFGVDRNPTAVWLCELRLWLSAVIDSQEVDPMRVPPLPNLDRNIRIGDSLAGAAFEAASVPRGGAAARRLRERYARATGGRKEALGREMDRMERRLALAALDAAALGIAAARRELVVASRGVDLFGERRPPRDTHRERRELRALATALRAERRRITSGGALPFSFGVHFADVAARGGFALIVGNPPWVRLHRIPAREREDLRRRFRVFRAAAWEVGARNANAGRGFAAQVDLAALFAERSLQLVRPGGAVALLLPAKLWRSLAGGGFRQLLTTAAQLRVLDDFSDAPSAFEASVYPSLAVAARNASSTGISPTPIAASTFRCHTRLAWRIDPHDLALDDSPGSPWIVVPPDVRAAFELLRHVGTPLSESVFGRPLLGVKSGRNDAFIVRCLHDHGRFADVAAGDGRRGHIEGDMLRPLVRGEIVRPWSRSPSDELMIWTHDEHGAPLARLPAGVARWLAPWATALATRSDARHGSRWWTIFRTEAARRDRPRVVWADVGRRPRALVLPAGDPTVPLNSCYVARARDDTDALALAVLLNGPLTAAWLSVLAEIARGGYRRFLGWTMALLPLPRAWDDVRGALASLGTRALDDPAAVTTTDLLVAALDAYDVARRDLAPLLAWYGG